MKGFYIELYKHVDKLLIHVISLYLNCYTGSGIYTEG